MLHQTTLTGLSTTQLEALRLQVCLDFFADETTNADREVLGRFDDAIKCSIPHSFVLANLFDVESMSLDIPEHVYESDPSLEWVTCPCCDGEKWLETDSNVWTHALYSDVRRAYVYRALNHSYKPCERCGASGEVLDLATPSSTTELFRNTPIPSLPKLLEPIHLMAA